MIAGAARSALSAVFLLGLGMCAMRAVADEAVPIVTTGTIRMTGLEPSNPYNLPPAETVQTVTIEMTGLEPSNPYNLPPAQTVQTMTIEMTGLDPSNPYNLPPAEILQTAAIEMTGWQPSLNVTGVAAASLLRALSGAWLDDDGQTLCVSVSDGELTARYPEPPQCRFGGEVEVFIHGDLAVDGALEGRIHKCEVNSPPRLVADCGLPSVRSRNFVATRVTPEVIAGTWDGEYIAYDRTADGGYRCTSFQPRPNTKQFTMRRAPAGLDALCGR